MRGRANDDDVYLFESMGGVAEPFFPKWAFYRTRIKFIYEGKLVFIGCWSRRCAIARGFHAIYHGALVYFDTMSARLRDSERAT